MKPISADLSGSRAAASQSSLAIGACVDTASMRLLVVEDDPMIGRAVRQGLVDSGFAVDWAEDGRAGELALVTDVYDLVLLDLGLPGKDGMTLLEGLRQRGNDVPLIIVTARDAVSQRIAGLNAGADDYLLKPFDLDELVARVRALLRRRAGTGSSLLTAGALVLDPIRKRVTVQEVEVTLSAREFALLEVLMQRPGSVLSRDKLEESVYGWGVEIGSNAIEVHLHHLRKKLGTDRIVNVRGVGYRVSEH
jgi:two-component system response regulator QseB